MCLAIGASDSSSLILLTIIWKVGVPMKRFRIPEIVHNRCCITTNITLCQENLCRLSYHRYVKIKLKHSVAIINKNQHVYYIIIIYTVYIYIYLSLFFLLCYVMVCYIFSFFFHLRITSRCSFCLNSINYFRCFFLI